MLMCDIFFATITLLARLLLHFQMSNRPSVVSFNWTLEKSMLEFIPILSHLDLCRRCCCCSSISNAFIRGLLLSWFSMHWIHHIQSYRYVIHMCCRSRAVHCIGKHFVVFSRFWSWSSLSSSSLFPSFYTSHFSLCLCLHTSMCEQNGNWGSAMVPILFQCMIYYENNNNAKMTRYRCEHRHTCTQNKPPWWQSDATLLECKKRRSSTQHTTGSIYMYQFILVLFVAFKRFKTRKKEMKQRKWRYSDKRQRKQIFSSVFAKDGDMGHL